MSLCARGIFPRFSGQKYRSQHVLIHFKFLNIFRQVKYGLPTVLPPPSTSNRFRCSSLSSSFLLLPFLLSLFLPHTICQWLLLIFTTFKFSSLSLYLTRCNLSSFYLPPSQLTLDCFSHRSGSLFSV